MSRFILRRLLQTVPVLLGVLTISFLLIRLVPGDPAQAMLGEYATDEAVRTLRESMGLSKPLYRQYLDLLSGYLRGDYGTSFRTGQPVFTEILRVFPYTLHLTILSVLLSVVIAIPAGVISAYRANSLLDTFMMGSALLGVSMPNFWVGLLLIIFFSGHLHWLPAVGAGSTDDPVSLLTHLILPSITLGTTIAALTARMVRSCVIDVLHQDYVRVARSKGLSEFAIAYRHVWPNALIPVVTVIGLNIGRLLGGQVIIEVVFARPGVGKQLFDAIIARDFPQLQASIVFFATLFLLVNLVVDLSYGFFDPRIRHSG